jgi:hypothetical protein
MFKVVAKKIILTTDLDLIKDGVQSIDNEFLEISLMRLMFLSSMFQSNNPVLRHQERSYNES